MPPFSDIEISTPKFETDGLRFLAFQSQALRRRGEVTLFIPSGQKEARDLPIALLLHGVLGTHWSWALNGGAHRTAQAMIDAGEIAPLVLAMPSDGLEGRGTGYVPHPHADYETWIVRDVLAATREVVPCVSERSRVFIAGLSMGGFGALRLGAKYADLFSGVSGHSSATEYDQLGVFVEMLPTRPAVADEAELTALHWMRAHRDRLPPVRFDCGVDDKLIEPNRALHAALEAEGIAHEFHEFPGAHSWAYWEEHLRDTLRFFLGL
ncbi:esterase family protein [Candidatus Sumerlaeota bacterium]|nr:esterase family protein [Candidatus Sumerlaeota bacterium]